MYQFYQNVLAIPARALYEDLDVMSKSNYDKLCRNGRLRKLRTAGGLENIALVDFEGIPERFKVEIVKKLGFPPKKITQNLILNHYTTDYEAIDFFANLKIDEYRTLSPEKQDEYVKNAQMLNALELYIKEMTSFRKSRGGSASRVWQDAAVAVSEVKDQMGHTLPKSERRLREKLADYKADGYQALVSENFGNNKAAKVKCTKQEALLRQLLRDHRNLDNEQIATVYNSVAKVQGFPELSSSTIGNYRKKWNLLVYAGTKGEKSFNNNISMQVKRAAPSSPLLYWTVDGWDAELLYQRQERGLNGENRTTYHNRLTIVVVLDPSINYPIGYAIGRQENAQLIKMALRNAVLHTQELFGDKHKVLQIQSDNYAKKQMTSFYEAISEKYTPAKVGNAKSKPIERWFGYFNKTYCQWAHNWSGMGVKSKQQPNDEFLNKTKNFLPDEKGCEAQLIRMIETEREKLREQYLNAYAEMPEDARKLMSNEEFLLHFGDTTGFTNKVNHNGLHIAINGRKYEYDSFDLNFRMHAHLDWTVKYDAENLQEVLALNVESGISFMLHQKYIQPMALYDREEGDAVELQRVHQFNKDLKVKYLETQAEDAKVVEQMFVQHPELDDTLAKLLIVDSSGQHKDRRNDNRLLPAKKLIEKQQKKETKEAEKNWADEQESYYNSKININKYLDHD